MKLYIIAGEASGDLHGANLMKALHALQPGMECRVWGGDRMQAAGGTLVRHYRDLAFMGFWEVLKNLRTILGNIAFCKRDILDFQPDALILVDYPGFNLRIARWARQLPAWPNGHKMRIIYYISPQIWAWHQSRVHDIKRDVDKMLVILPFERDFYNRYGVDVEYVGHPLLDALKETPTTPERSFSSDAEDRREIIALLPGSRKQEVSRMLPLMLEIADRFPQYRFVVAGATALPKTYYEPFLEAHPDVGWTQGESYALLRSAKAALVKSGTSTLETALLDVPQAVCYTGSPISYAIAKRLVSVKYISLVNLILDRPLVRELIQSDFNANNLENALSDILKPERAAEIRQGYENLRRVLGDGGASQRAAESALRSLQAPE